jgi:Undecaprenyl-phosphate galactose phosphotransferase WbaP
LGYKEAGAKVVTLLKEEWELGYDPVAIFDYRLDTTGEVLEGGDNRQVLAAVVDTASEHGVDTAIFAMPNIRREQLSRLVNLASLRFRQVVVIPNLDGITNSAVVARDFAGTFGVEIKYNLLDPWARRVKRALDLVGSVMGGLLISPVFVAIVVLIKLGSPGPAFYGHWRVGIGGRHFRCWKFRTMQLNAEQLLEEYLQTNLDLRAEWEENQKLQDDPRVTRAGRFLRKTSLDELPQLWNVLRGEMSLTGPRPIVDAEVPKYGNVYELYKRIRPGMSGFWQVSGRSDTSYVERVAMDSHYVRNWSVWLDLIILTRTVKIVLLGRGAR